VLKLTVRHPVVVAKQAASLAVMSGNRLKLGVGSSPWREDYEVLGVPFEGRGARFEQAIDVVRRLSAGGYVESEAAAYPLPAIKIDPVPSRPIPLLVGGHGKANLQRAGRLADGWIAAAVPLDRLQLLIEQVRAARRAAGRAAEPFEIHASGQNGRDRDGIERLAALGVTHVSVRPAPNDREVTTVSDAVAELGRFAAEQLA
jgi:alkanesulfonate monooxygenase SsuD/methylene tetrahydromethanopterin reductase-like flavin-dependent oxidoreductase (luciferase family)